MDDIVNRLLATIDETVCLLRLYSVGQWAEWLSNDAAAIQGSDFHGVAHLLSGFGGMGSFSDVWICPENGHKINQSDVQRVNEKLQKLSSEIYRLADKLRREYQKNAT
jgi:hypothetical protein